MKIDISKIAHSEGRLPAEGSVNPGRLSFDGGEYAFSEVKVAGEIVNIGGSLELKATAAGEYTTPCARCLKPVTISFDADIYEELGDDENKKAISSDGCVCELDFIVINSILSQLPMVTLCREDCPGLCPSCGKDLNEGSCDCKEDDWDPRFDILKNFKADL